jgi:hypothetical protein
MALVTDHVSYEQHLSVDLAAALRPRVGASAGMSCADCAASNAPNAERCCSCKQFLR